MELLGVAWSNFLVGVFAALLVGGANWVKGYAHDKYLERRYPIAGEYITTFEDEADGEDFVATAPAKLEQKGKTVTGRTVMPGDNRQWVLEGKLSDDGYINGIYYAVDPHDRGVGNFFLYVNHDRQMEGIWSGYDEINDKISSGRYTFRPTFDAFSIQPLDAGQVPAVIDVADRRLGKDYLSAALLKESLSTDSPYFATVAVVESEFQTEASLADRLAERLLSSGPPQLAEEIVPGDGHSSEVIGFCLGAVFDQEGLQSYLNVPAAELPVGLQHADRVGVVRTAALREGFERRGIGTRLVEHCLETCRERGATALCAVGWEEGDDVNIRGMMQHFDFEQADRFDDYWREESLEHGFQCEDCGEPPCHCSAVLFTRYS